MRLAIVIPIFNERQTLPKLVERLDAVLDALPGVASKVWLVDDGSRDGSRQFLRELAAEKSRYGVVELSRNFGHQPAISAGLAAAEGDAVVVMDGDLQDPPEVIPQLLEKWRGGAEVVSVVRRSRADRGLRGLGFRSFHWVMSWMTDLPMQRNAGVFGLLDAQALAALRQMPERNRFLPGLQHWVGFERAAVWIDRPERAEGQSRQPLFRLVRYALDAFFSFSYKPLRLVTYGGLLISGLGFALALAFVFRRLLGYEIAEIGFTTLVTLILFLGGVQLVSLGVLGEYIARIYDEAKARPLYITRRGLPRGIEAEAALVEPGDPGGGVGSAAGLVEERRVAGATREAGDVG